MFKTEGLRIKEGGIGDDGIKIYLKISNFKLNQVAFEI
jgi:hypothetical protein